MKYFRVILMIVFVSANVGCKKNIANPGHTLRFGSGCASCFIYYKSFYSINNVALYQDTIHLTTAEHFSSIPMPASKYLIAKPLLVNLPQYLSMGNGGRVGYTGTVDGFFLHFEYIVNPGDTIKWDMNPDTSFLPVEIRSYVQQANTVINQL